MIIIDDRIVTNNKELFTTMVGKTLNYYKHDPFLYSNSVYKIVGIYIEDDIYAITNSIQVRDYYGAPDDVGIFKINKVKDKDIHSFIEDQSLIVTPVNNSIKKIIVVNENQKSFNNNALQYDVYLTRGIIFEMIDGLQISFEKDIWFSEDINIERGYNLIDKLYSVDDFINNWELPYRGECIRTNITFE